MQGLYIRVIFAKTELQLDQAGSARRDDDARAGRGNVLDFLVQNRLRNFGVHKAVRPAASAALIGIGNTRDGQPVDGSQKFARGLGDLLSVLGFARIVISNRRTIPRYFL